MKVLVMDYLFDKTSQNLYSMEYDGMTQGTMRRGLLYRIEIFIR